MAHDIPVLLPLFDRLAELSYHGKPLSDYAYYIMGQICIDEACRGQGIFRKLYEAHKVHFHADYDYCFTEISSSNHKSLAAHASVGFKTMDTYSDDNDKWVIVALDLMEE